MTSTPERSRCTLCDSRDCGCVLGRPPHEMAPYATDLPAPGATASQWDEGFEDPNLGPWVEVRRLREQVTSLTAALARIAEEAALTKTAMVVRLRAISDLAEAALGGSQNG